MRISNGIGVRRAALGALLLVASTEAYAAQVVSLRQVQASSTARPADLAASVLAVDARTNFVAVKQEKNAKESYGKFQQMFDGIPVQGYQTIVASTNGNIRIHGYKVNGIDGDLKSTEVAYTPKEALALAKADFQKSVGSNIFKFEREDVKKIIYIDVGNNNTAHVAYRVTFYADALMKGKPTMPVYTYDAVTKKRLGFYDQLMFQHSTARGPGGNEKMGRYDYGKEYPELVVETSSKAGTCVMDSPNVDTVDMRHEDPDGAAGGGGMGGGGGGGGTYDPFEFKCGENTYQSINGAYSPINDGHFFGNVTFNMYNDWFQLNPIKTKLRVRVHYATNFSNAFWDGKQMTFGDGGPSDQGGTKIDIFHPLVSLDVMAHEVSHGFTEFNSGLEYFGEPGGINEAFSDIAGEAAEFYSRGHNDWLVGSDVVKKDASINGQPWGQVALRYFEDPSKDGRSAKDMDGFKWGFQCDLCAQIMDPPQICSVLLGDACMDVHLSSGIYNRAFYLLATTKGWDTKMAFQAFLRANQKYWSPKTTFADGAAGVRDAAKDLNFDTAAVVAAFKTVGISL